ncbi:hypothetical protein CBL_03118 [Carabus blaptoides fortunei]
MLFNKLTGINLNSRKFCFVLCYTDYQTKITSKNCVDNYITMTLETVPKDLRGLRACLNEKQPRQCV